MLKKKIIERINKIDKKNIEAIALMGSYARNEAEKYSDIDIVCFVKNIKDYNDKNQIELLMDKYLVISYVDIQEVESWFTEPEKAVSYIYGLRTAKPLWDPNGFLEKIQRRALNFIWDDAMQRKANQYASKELISWIEEVHKALQGLILNDNGRMLNGLHGLTFGLFRVITVQKGILLRSDNSFFEQVLEGFGEGSQFTKLARESFGIGCALNIRERVISGLKLFLIVIDMMMDKFNEQDKKMICLVREEIGNELEIYGII